MCYVSSYLSCLCVSHFFDCLHLFYLSDISLPSVVYLSMFSPWCHFCVLLVCSPVLSASLCLYLLLVTHVTLVARACFMFVQPACSLCLHLGPQPLKKTKKTKTKKKTVFDVNKHAVWVKMFTFIFSSDSLFIPQLDYFFFFFFESVMLTLPIWLQQWDCTGCIFLRRPTLQSKCNKNLTKRFFFFFFKCLLCDHCPRQ